MRSVFIILFAMACPFASIYGETIVLKSGKTVEGNIIKRTDSYIRVSTDTFPLGLTYYLDDIERIGRVDSVFPLSNDAVATPYTKGPEVEAVEKEAAAPPRASEPDDVPLDQDLIPFKLGIQKVGINILNFQFSGNGQELLAVNMGDWQGRRSADQTKLVIKLYDRKKKLIERAESLCVAENVLTFGPITCAATKKTVEKVAFFSALLDECLETNSGLDESRSEVQFARTIETAIKESKEAYFSLFLKPPSKADMAMEEFIYQSLRVMLTGGGRIISVAPMAPEAAQKFRGVCARCYEVAIEQKGLGGSSILTVLIGKVKNDWRILSEENR